MSRISQDAAIEEASVWLALLHGPRRDADIAAGFKRWMDESPAHREAFEAVTGMWEVAAALPRRPIPVPQRWRRVGFHTGLRWAVGLVGATAVLMVVTALWYSRHAGIATTIGEQRMLTLADGSRVYLNTDTRVRVDYTSARRGIELERGEALFEVTRSLPNRPFVVQAGGREITALGTSFVVRRDVAAVSVTLVDGRVAVSESTTSPPRVLAPGERLTLVSHGKTMTDRPVVDKVTAWRRGRVELDETLLARAVEEMNRYSAQRVVVEGAAASIPVTGAFRAGDSLSFAQSVASSCDLKVEQRSDEILLSGEPSEKCR